MSSSFTFYFLGFILFFLSNLGKGQTIDSIEVEEEIIDTVIIKKGQVVIKQTYYLEDTIKKSRKPKVIETFINSGSYSNYYSTCTYCASYTDKIKASTTPVLSYGIGINTSIFLKRFVFLLGVNYNSYRERFKYTDSFNVSYNNINSLNYLGINVGGGVNLLTAKKVSLQVISEAGIVRLLTSRGKTISPVGNGEVINNNSSTFYSKYNYILMGGIKVYYKITSEISCWLQPYFQGDLWTVTNSTHPFLQQKAFMGSRLGVAYILN